MEELRRLKDDYIRDLIEYYEAEGITAKSIDNMDTMIHSIKNLCKIMHMSDQDEGYSMGYSMRRGRGANASRDSLGRYSSGRYSMDTSDMVAKLHDIINHMDMQH